MEMGYTLAETIDSKEPLTQTHYTADPKELLEKELENDRNEGKDEGEFFNEVSKDNTFQAHRCVFDPGGSEVDWLPNFLEVRFRAFGCIEADFCNNRFIELYSEAC